MAARSTLFRDLLFWLKSQLSSNITDPISGSRGSSSAFIMTSYPEREVKYPLITLDISNVNQTRAGMQTTTMDISLTVEVRIYSESKGLSDRISQEVLNYLASIQFTASTGSTANDFHDFTIDSAVPIDEQGEGGTHQRVIQLNYKFYNAT